MDTWAHGHMPENLTHGYKKIITNSKQKEFSCWKNSTRQWIGAGLINEKCLGGYFDLSSKTYRDFF